ncbi:MAG: pseudouridine synthase [Traorella sp.]
MERLQKVIASSGLTSRRKAETMIVENRVKVNGKLINELGYKVKKGDQIEVDGKLIQRENKVYYVMNKPKKTICTLNDEHNRKTVVSLIECEERIFPVGRLDYDTSGVLILTNDGEFANLITHPRYHLYKTYDVLIDGILNSSQIKQMEKGIPLEDGMTLPSKVRIRKKDFEHKKTKFDLTIQEGRNHQVKRMVEYFGYQVTSLHRKSIGFLKVDDMSQGQYRILKPQEVKDLRKLANEGKQ